MSGEVVHFEVPADNVDRAGKFYQKIFGWRLTPLPQMNYTMLGTAPVDKDGMPTEPGTINGGMGKRGGPLEHPVFTIMVDEITTTEKEIVKNGGKIIQKKQPIGDGSMGFTGYFRDSEGNVVGLFQQPKT
ncbi:MAG: VOC family protein [Thermoplasmata archaeon]|jgi:predicted enzyme related to lactoylglutathione lyase